jgi:prolipoprotein diacylglyceryl transferase
MIVSTVLASIPSPSKGTLDLGPLSIHAYGLMIALGVVAAVWLLGRRLELSGVGTREDASSVSVWGVVAGILGARLYHVATDWSSFEHDLPRIVMIWKGGLGVPGGLLAGIVVGLWAGKRRGIPPAVLANAAAPAIPLAQAIGRWGNWFNQELFGKVTDLPWALRVSDSTAIAAGYPGGTTFHPTFLYESLWNLALCAVLLAVDRRWKVRPPRLMVMYLFGYGVGRFWVEGLRIDPADHIGGLRWNQWVALTVAVVSAVYLLVTARRRPDAEATDDAGLHDPDDDDEYQPDSDENDDEFDEVESESDPDDQAEYLAADEQLHD